MKLQLKWLLQGAQYDLQPDGKHVEAYSLRTLRAVDCLEAKEGGGCLQRVSARDKRGYDELHPSRVRACAPAPEIWVRGLGEERIRTKERMCETYVAHRRRTFKRTLFRGQTGVSVGHILLIWLNPTLLVQYLSYGGKGMVRSHSYD